MADRPTDGVTPFLTIRDRRGREACRFYEAAFGAEVVEENLADDGERLMQAGLRLNGGWIMLSDEFPEHMPPGARSGAPEGITLHLQVADCDAAFERAAAAGATVTMPAQDMFWGDRYGQLKDPFGHAWSIGSPLKA